jgi:hypothetical protein
MSAKKPSISTSPEDLGGSLITRYLSTPQAAIYLSFSSRWLEKLRQTGGGPRFVRKGRKKIVYDIQHLDEWMAKDVRSSTSDHGHDEEA